MKAIKGRFFFGGTHPDDKKSLSKGAPIEEMPEPDFVAVNLSQSLGKPSVPCVQPGDKVAEGQVIALADGPISSDVFASISGTVKEISARPAENGADGQFIVIEADNSKNRRYLRPLLDPSQDEIIERARLAGIVGLGGAGFPTAVKLKPAKPVDTLIINGAECEPYLTCDYRLMLEKSEDITRGAFYIAKALGVKKVIIAIERNKPDCIELFERQNKLDVVSLRKVYPIGGEKQIIYSATGRKVPPGKLPFDVGVIVENVATCFALCEAVELGKPLYERVLSVSGGAIKEPKNLKVRVGTPIAKIVEYCGGETETPVKAVLGGPMTGIAVNSYDLYTKKTTSGVLLLSEKESKPKRQTPCLSCGKCADHCPMRLMPMNTEFYTRSGNFESAAKYGGAEYCIECGVCEYVCPAKRPLIQAIRETKAALKQIRSGGNS